MNETSELRFEFPKVDDKSRNIIKVIGVGGGGGNAVQNMFKQDVKNVSYAIANTDSQALSISEIAAKLPLGNSGLGVGGDPEKGREEAEYSVEDIKKLLSDGTKMVFITAGMGGGTGTGAAPVVARVAREMGILTVGIVTIPFRFEKRLRIEKALSGVEAMKQNVDSLLVINNERLLQIYSDGITTVEDAFQTADDVVTVSARSIAEIITLKGKVNRDFCDVESVMKNGGGAIVSEGRANGENRILKAMKDALQSPLFNKVEIEKAQRMLYVIYQSHKNPVKVSELIDINNFMDNLSNDLEVLWGLYWDESLDDDVRVTLIATGFDKERVTTQELAGARSGGLERWYEWYYGGEKPHPDPPQKERGKGCAENEEEKPLFVTPEGEGGCAEDEDVEVEEEVSRSWFDVLVEKMERKLEVMMD